MSVDTYPQRKRDLKGYKRQNQDGVEVFISDSLAEVAGGVQVGIRKFLVFKSFSIELEPKDSRVRSYRS